ncbi:wd g-beta repeat-containing protein [Cystoisospora suis]|uniref:Wd g-beta repeat-containing protein n=1 Tax=Cystoisospora suis TaxID=483139 RepID=A0A2C6KP70_9APIC|nr:wd g-beta repeat-containing protein [Cystoisospora suis]
MESSNREVPVPSSAPDLPEGEDSSRDKGASLRTDDGQNPVAPTRQQAGEAEIPVDDKQEPSRPECSGSALAVPKDFPAMSSAASSSETTPNDGECLRSDRTEMCSGEPEPASNAAYLEKDVAPPELRGKEASTATYIKDGDIPDGCPSEGLRYDDTSKSTGQNGEDLNSPALCEITETEILKRMHLNLEADQDGVGRLTVKQANLKRMGLLVSDQDTEILVPYKIFSKNEVFQEIQKLGKDSDWSDHKAVLRMCSLEELLVVRDEEKLYGSNYVWIFTELAYEKTVQLINERRQEAKARYTQERTATLLKNEQGTGASRHTFGGSILAGKWNSTTSNVTEEEIRQMTLQPKRPFISRIVSRKHRLFGETRKFQPTSDKIHSCRPQKNNNFVVLRKELDFGVQAVSATAETGAQTSLCIPKNACTQYDNADLWAKTNFDDQENKAFAAFFARVAGLVEEALQQNETINVFGEDFATLGTEEFVTTQANGEGLKEMMNFTDLTYSKAKLITCIQWVPDSDTLISYACMENATFEERIEKSGRATQGFILVWHFDDIIVPQAVFSAPADPTVFRYCEVDGELYIVGGLITGQLAIWKADGLISSSTVSTEWHRTHQQQVRATKPMITSSIDFSHRRTVSDIRVLPPGTDFRKNFKLAFNPNSTVVYLASSAGDGCIMIWDVTSAVHSVVVENFQWRPFLQAPLKRAESGVDLGCCHLIVPKTEPGEVTTSFWASTEDGELLIGDWGQPTEDKKAEHIKTFLTETRSCRPTLGFEVSPFFDDVFLTVMDLNFHIWKLDCSSPVFTSPTSPVCYSSGTWSPTRPSVFFLGRVDGSLEVWDLSEQSQTYSVAFIVGAAAITCLSFHPPRSTDRRQSTADKRLPRKESRPVGALQKATDSVMFLVAAGDASGIVHIVSLPKNLTVPTPGEFGVVQAMFAREKDVVQYVIERRDAVKKELGLAESANSVARPGGREASGHGRGRPKKIVAIQAAG